MTLSLSVGQWIAVTWVVGIVLWAPFRFAQKDEKPWGVKLCYLAVWPIVLVWLLSAGTLVGFGRLVGGKDWNKVEEPECVVCSGHALVPFNELEERAELAQVGKSKDPPADLKLFAGIVKEFVRKHRWDKDAKKDTPE